MYTTRGFSLIEAVVGIAIVGIIVTVFSSFLWRFPVDSRVARNQDLALSIAHNELEALRAGGYDILPTSGSFGDTQMGSLPGGAGNLVVTAASSDLAQIVVTVSWTDTDAIPRSVSLTSLIGKNSALK